MTASNVAADLPADAFSLSPDPARVFPRRDHAEALAALEEGLRERRGLLVTVAEVGMGKTTLAYTLLSSLGTDVRTAYVANPRLPLDGLLRHVLADFGAPYEGHDRTQLLAALRSFLEQCAAGGDWAVLVIDEAQSLADETFAELPLLLDAVPGSLQIILVGQPEVDAKLRQPHLAGIAARIGGRVELRPLDGTETRRYVAHRLAQSGGAIEMFSAPALDLIVRRAEGVPRRVNILCHNALLLAYAAGGRHVTRAMAQEAIGDLGGGVLVRLRRSAAADAARGGWRSRGVRWSAGAVATAVVATLLVVHIHQPVTPPPSRVALAEPQAKPALPAPPPVSADRVRVESERSPNPPSVEPPSPPPAAVPPPAPAPVEVVTTPPPAVAPAPPPVAEPAVPPPVEVAAAAPAPVAPAPVVTTSPPVTEPPPAAAALPAAAPSVAAAPPVVVPARAVPSPPVRIPAPRSAPAPAPTATVAPPPTPRPAEQVARATPSAPVEPPSEAPAPPPAAAPSGVTDLDVRAFLDRYVEAWRAQDLAELRRIGQVVDDRQASALGRYFEGVRDLHVEVHVLDVRGSGAERTVRFTRRDRFRDPTGREVSQESPPIEKTIVRTPDGLRFAPRS